MRAPYPHPALRATFPQGKASAAAGISPPVACGNSPLLVEGTFRPMSTRKGQAASVTLLRREQLRSASAPTKSIVDSPTSIRRKSRARLWSIEGVRGNHPKVFPGLFSFARRFLFGEAKRKCRPFPLSWKKQTKKTMWTPNRLGISKNSARWRKNTEKARKIPNHFKNIPCFFRQRVV